MLNETNNIIQPSTLAGRTPRAFWAAKAGNAVGDYEDAFALGHDCIAIADGATESSFARAWAQALVEGFVADPGATHPPGIRRLQTWLRPLQAAWHSGVAWDRLPWFAEDKARSGAFATFLGFQMLTREGTGNSPQGTEVEIEAAPEMQSSLAISFLGAAQSALGDNLIDIEADEEGAFVAFAIGDSCLFLIRDEGLELAFPLSHSSQFDSRPILLCSNDSNNKQVWDDITLERGTLQSGDTLLFATDALARWFLAQCETGAKPWETLCALGSQADFDIFIASLRKSHVMRNDDVTLIVLDANVEDGMTIDDAEGAEEGGTEVNISANANDISPADAVNSANTATRAEEEIGAGGAATMNTNG